MLRCFGVQQLQQLHDRITSRKRFDVRGSTIRRSSRLPLWELNISIDSMKLGPLIVVYSLIKTLIGLSVDHP